MLRTNRLLVVMFAGASVLAACSDAKGSALNLGTSPASTSAPTTSTAAVTTSDAPATTTTVGSTTSTTLPSEEEQVKADFLAAMAVRRQCGLDPANCDYAALAIPSSPMERVTRDLMKFRIENNLSAVAGHGDLKLRVEEIQSLDQKASLVACGYDNIVIFDVGDPGNPDDDIVFNDSAGSARTTWTLERQNNRWLIWDGVPIQELSGGDLCGF